MSKNILVTGATSGIGYEVSTKLASKGYSIYFTARDGVRALNLKMELLKLGSPDSKAYITDFASSSSVQKTGLEIIKDGKQIDVLINNAGTWEMDFKESKDGIEMNFAVNHLAPFLLTNLLLPSFLKNDTGRIINTSSMAHRRNILDLNDIEFRNQPYNGIAGK